MLKKASVASLLILLLITGRCPVARADRDSSQAASERARGMVAAGAFAVEKNGQLIAAHNLHDRFVPASIIKIATSLAALQVLGPGFRFETHFYRDKEKNLYIRGGGDPFLVSEEVAVIVIRLKELGCDKINDIYIDDSAFFIPVHADGAGFSDNPYDAKNSALAVNFNTVNVLKEVSGIRSAEEQTPYLPLMSELADKLEPGEHRINITREQQNGSSVIYRYAGELFRAFQSRENIGGQGKIAARKVPVGLEAFYVHKSSRTLEEVIGPLMLYSNNFIANQLFLLTGAKRYGFPATWEKSRRAMEELLQSEFSLSASEISMVEGSGLSRKNLVSVHAMMRLLDAFKPFAAHLPEEDGKLLKSGTLKRIYSYAGYFIDNSNLDSFALILNQEKNNRDQVLRALEQVYSTN